MTLYGLLKCKWDADGVYGIMARKMDSSPTKGGHERSIRKLNKPKKEPVSPFHKLRPPPCTLLEAHGQCSLRQTANAQQQEDGTLLTPPAEPAWGEMFMPKWQASPQLLKCASCFRFLIKKETSIFCQFGQQREENEFGLWAQLYKRPCTMTFPYPGHPHPLGRWIFFFFFCEGGDML